MERGGDHRMSRLPCLIDSPTIRQSITVAGYQADVIVDPDATNGITVDSGGLSVKYPVAHSARIANTTPQAVNLAGASTPMTFPTIRWDTIGAITATANRLTTSANGLWLFGAHIGLVEGGFFGFNWTATIADKSPSPTFGCFAEDTVYTGDGLFTPGVAETGIVCAHPTAIMEMPAGVQVGVDTYFDETGVLAPAPTTGASSSPPTATAARNEMAGMEFWCVLLVPYAV